MRYLLQSQHVYADVHRDAAAWFEARIAPDAMNADIASEPPSGGGSTHDTAQHWALLRQNCSLAADLAVEVLFHHFQAEGSAASTHWHRLLSVPFARFPEHRARMAAALLGGDYLDDDGDPLPHQRTGQIIDVETVAEAHLEIAKALSAELLRSVRHGDSAEDALMNRIEAHLGAIRRIEAQLGRAVIGPERFEVEAQVLLHLGREADALALVERSIAAATVTPIIAVRLLVMKGNLIARRSVDAAHASFEDAIQLARTALADRGTLVATIRSVQGMLERDRGRLDAARRYFEESLTATGAAGGSTADLVRRAGRLVDVLDASARWSAIPEWLAYVEAHADDRTAAQTFSADQRCRLELAERRLSPIVATSDDPAHALWRASRLALMHHRGAVDAFQLATRLFERAQNTVAAQGCEIERLEFITHVVGNHNEARTLASKLDPTGPNWLRGEMALIDLLRHGARERAVQQWKRVWTEAAQRAGVRERVSAFAHAIACGIEPAAAGDDLASLLAQVTPADARIPLLAPLEHWTPEVPGAQGDPQPALLAVLPELPAVDPDFVLRAAPLARALQFAGASDRGRQLIVDALAQVAPSAEPLVGRRLLAAARHLNVVVNNDVIDAYLAAVRALCAEYPGLIVATHVEQAEWWIEKGDAAAAIAALAQVTLPEGEPDQFTCRFMALQSRLADDDMQANLWGSQALSVAARLGLPEGRVNLREVRIDDKPVYASPFRLQATVLDVRHPAEYRIDRHRANTRSRRSGSADLAQDQHSPDQHPQQPRLGRRARDAARRSPARDTGARPRPPAAVARRRRSRPAPSLRRRRDGGVAVGVGDGRGSVRLRRANDRAGSGHGDGALDAVGTHPPRHTAHHRRCRRSADLWRPHRVRCRARRARTGGRHRADDPARARAAAARADRRPRPHLRGGALVPERLRCVRHRPGQGVAGHLHTVLPRRAVGHVVAPRWADVAPRGPPAYHARRVADRIGSQARHVRTERRARVADSARADTWRAQPPAGVGVRRRRTAVRDPRRAAQRIARGDGEAAVPAQPVRAPAVRARAHARRPRNRVGR
ncbi:MAG: hypothetical protein QM736_26260 [Vicinamibacterales bacterium]